MSFSAGPEAYDRFMGRYSMPLASRFAEFAGVTAGQRVLDVGCGPGALTGELVRRLGPAAVCAVDPSEQFVEAVRDRYAGVRTRRGSAEALPFEDALFEVTLAQLVVHFMADPVIGLAAAGVREVQASSLTVAVEHHSFEEWWQPYMLGVGPAGSLVARLNPERQARLRELCRERLPASPFVVSATAWAARGLV